MKKENLYISLVNNFHLIGMGHPYCRKHFFKKCNHVIKLYLRAQP